MGIIARQTIKSSIFVYLGVLFGAFNRLFLYPKFMTPEQIGFMSVFFTIAMLLSQFGMLGTGNTYNKYFHLYTEKKLLPHFNFLFIGTSLLGVLIVCLLAFAFQTQLINYFSKDSNLLTDYWHYVAPFAFILVFNNVFTGIARSYLRLTVPSIFNDFMVRVFTGLGILLYGFQIIDFTTFVISHVATFLLADLGILAYLLRLFNIRISHKIKQITRDEYRQMGYYTLFIFAGSLSASVVQYTDTLILSSLKGFDAVGVFSIAFFMGTIIEVPKRSIVSISMPIVSKFWHDNDMPSMQNLYRQSSINQGIIGLALLLLIWVNIDGIFAFIPESSVYQKGKWVVLIIGLARVVDMFMGINSEILRTSKHYRYDFWITVGLIGISVGANYALIPIFGIDGAALATLFSVSMYNILRYITLKKLYGLSPFGPKSFLLVFIFVALFGVNAVSNLFIPNLENIYAVLASMIIKSIFFGGLVFGLTYGFHLSPEFNQLVLQTLQKVGIRKGKP